MNASTLVLNDIQKRNRRWAWFQNALLTEKTREGRYITISEELREIRKTGESFIIHDENKTLVEALREARSSSTTDWKFIMMIYDLGEPDHGSKTRFNYPELTKRCHLVDYINFLKVAHHYGQLEI